MPQTMENCLPHFWKINCPFLWKSTCRLQETKYYVVAENVENKISNLYDQINYLSIDLKKQG